MNPDGSNAISAEPQMAGSPFVSPQRIEMETVPAPRPEVDRPLDEENSAPVQEASRPEADQPMAEKKKGDNNLVHFEDRPSFNFGLLLAWVIALLAIMATLYFWWLNRNLTDTLTDKQEKRSAVVSLLESPGNKEVEAEANNFKASVAALSAAKAARSPMATFLPDFYTKIDKDVKITSLSITSGGAFSIAGSTTSYRAIADQVMALKSWSMLSEVDLASPSYSTDATTAKTEAAKFSVTAKVKQAVPAATASSSVPSVTATGGAQ